MRRALTALFVLAAACDGEPAERNEGPTLEQIREVSTPSNDAAANVAGSIVFQPLTTADLAGSGFTERDCRFVRNGQLLVAAGGGAAIARIGGGLRHFVPAAPPAATGAFLEDRQISVSIGRTAPDGTAARLAVTNRRTGAEDQWAGDWTCDP